MTPVERDVTRGLAMRFWKLWRPEPVERELARDAASLNRAIDVKRGGPYTPITIDPSARPVPIRSLDGQSWASGKPLERGGLYRDSNGALRPFHVIDVWLGEAQRPRDLFLAVLNMPGAQE